MPAKTTSATSRITGFLRLASALGRNRAGTSAIEFALLIIPFLIFLLLILEIGAVFLMGNVLENATQQAARLIRTGQTVTKESFGQQVCTNLRIFTDCAGRLKIDVRVLPTFGAADPTPKYDEDGELDDEDFDFDAGRGNDIVMVRVYLDWPVTPALPALLRLLRLDPAVPPGGNYLLVSTAIFRNEPFS